MSSQLPMPNNYSSAVEYWSTRAKLQGKNYVGKSGFVLSDQTHAIQELLNSHIGTGRYQHALDYGCGWGRMCAFLGKFADHVTGCDIIDTFDHKHTGGADFLLITNPAHIGVPDNTFDFIYVGLCFQHILDEKWFSEVTKEIRRVARPGAKIIVLDDANSRAPHIKLRAGGDIARALDMEIESTVVYQVKVDPHPTVHNLIIGNKRSLFMSKVAYARAIWFLATNDYLPHLRCLVTTLKAYGKIGDMPLLLVALGDCAPERLSWFRLQGVEIIRKDAHGGVFRGGLRWKWHKTQIFKYAPALREALYLDCDIVATGNIAGIWDHVPYGTEVVSIPWSKRPHRDPFTLNHYREFSALGYLCFRTGVMIYKRGVTDEFLEDWGKAMNPDWIVRSSTMDQPQLYCMLTRTNGKYKIHPIPNMYDRDTKTGVMPPGKAHVLVHYHNLIPKSLPQFAYLRGLNFVGPNGDPDKVDFTG